VINTPHLLLDTGRTTLQIPDRAGRKPWIDDAVMIRKVAGRLRRALAFKIRPRSAHDPNEFRNLLHDRIAIHRRADGDAQVKS